MSTIKPFAKKYPMTRKEWEDISYEYMFSTERTSGVSFRSFVVKKLGKRK